MISDKRIEEMVTHVFAGWRMHELRTLITLLQGLSEQGRRRLSQLLQAIVYEDEHGDNSSSLEVKP